MGQALGQPSWCTTCKRLLALATSCKPPNGKGLLVLSVTEAFNASLQSLIFDHRNLESQRLEGSHCRSSKSPPKRKNSRRGISWAGWCDSIVSSIVLFPVKSAPCPEPLKPPTVVVLHDHRCTSDVSFCCTPDHLSPVHPKSSDMILITAAAAPFFLFSFLDSRPFWDCSARRLSSKTLQNATERCEHPRHAPKNA